MSQISLTFPDGNARSFEAGVTGNERLRHDDREPAVWTGRDSRRVGAVVDEALRVAVEIEDEGRWLRALLV